MKFPLSRFLVLGTWFCYQTVSAQFYTSGTDPASIRWKQLNTPQAQIIFPSGFDSVANRLAAMYEFLYPGASKSLGVSPGKISIIIHNHSVNSNGFVTLGPRRMELYSTPPQQNTALDWLSDLAVHEFRHVAQIGKVNQGITRLSYPFFGQLSSGIVSAMMPLWFVEGDAVYAETMLTNSGRGRTGDFTMAFKPILADNKSLFSFEKTLYGSYKHFIPDHYRTGYLMVSTVRQRYGTDIFEKSIRYLARNPYIPFSFSNKLKIETGKTARQLYKEVFFNLKNEVISEKSQYHLYTSFSGTTPKIYTAYNYPQYFNDNTIIAVKSGLANISQFVYLNKNGTEKVLFTPGNLSSNRFSYTGGFIAWTEEVPDLRWSNRSYSCIRLLNIENGTTKWLSHKTRYFSAALSPNGKLVATIEIDLQNNAFLVIIDTQTGKIEDRIASPDNLMLADPAFTNNKNAIILVGSGISGKALFRFSYTQRTWERITPFSWHNLTCPSEWNNLFIYAADYNGHNNIFAFNPTSGKIHPITHARYGAFEPYLDTKNSVIGFTEYCSHGFMPQLLPFSDTVLQKTIIPEINSDSLILAGTQTENFNFQDSFINRPELLKKTYTIKPYRKIPNAIHVHSWSPFYYDYNNLDFSNQEVFPGITLLSQNKLGNTISTLSYFNEMGFWKIKPRLIYKGWYPVIDVSIDYGGQIPYYKRFNKAAPPQNGYFSVNPLIYVPFNLSRGAYYTNITPIAEIQYENTRLFYTSDSSYRKGTLFTYLGFNAYSYFKTSERDIAPKFGFMVTARYKYAPFHKSHFGDLAYIKPRVYLPGLFQHHSLQLSAGYQYQNPGIYMYSDLILTARGYAVGNSKKLLTFSADYAFPVWYPDINLGPLMYIKRFRANLFCDMAQSNYRDFASRTWKLKNYQSVGIDWLADFHALHIYFPFTAGLRTCYLPTEQATINQFFINIDFRF